MRVFLLLLAVGFTLALTPVPQVGPPRISVAVHAYPPKDMEVCGHWLAARRHDRDGANTVEANIGRAWMWGFVSGAAYGGRDLRKTDRDSIDAWTDKYCGDHPRDSLAVAGFRLVNELSGPAKNGR